MPEATYDATFLVTISHQAMQRACDGDQLTQPFDCIVVIIFAGFYIEANLNYIIKNIGRNKDLYKYFNRQNLGLGQKLAWFYNEYIARKKAEKVEDLGKNGLNIYRKMSKKFHGIGEIRRYRNLISHGKVDTIGLNILTADHLRQRAIDITNDLYKIAKSNGFEMKRLVSFEDVLLEHYSHQYPFDWDLPDNYFTLSREKYST